MPCRQWRAKERKGEPARDNDGDKISMLKVYILTADTSLPLCERTHSHTDTQTYTRAHKGRDGQAQHCTVFF